MSNSQKRYPDGFIRRKPVSYSRPVSRVNGTRVLTNNDLAAHLAYQDYQQQARRIRKVARILIVATRLNTTYKQLLHIRRRKRIVTSVRYIRHNSPRFAAILFLCGFVASSLIPPLLQANNEKLVQLNQASKLLVGDTRDDAARYLKYDDKSAAYTFAAESRDTSDTYDHTGRSADAYEATIPKKASNGITVTDTQSKIDIRLTPQFFTTEAEKSEGNNLIYRSGNRQLIYTLKYNGLKEDIILPSYQGDNLQFNFRLSLPAGVEARLDAVGNIGIYSSDPTLFGNISFGSDQDRSKVESAREKAPKNNLVMTIPYPVVKDAKGKEYTNKATYTLGDKRTEKRYVDLPNNAGSQLSTFTTYNLGLRTKSLKSLTYPISLDPTIQVTNSADFSTINNEGGVSADTTNNLIKRSSLTGGSVAGWTQATNNPNTLPVAGYGPDFQVYNDKLYYIRASSNIFYAPFNPSGDIGTFVDTGVSAPGGTQYGSSAIYNGYLYVGTGSQYYYSKIKSDGSINAFTATNVFSTPNGAARGAYAISAYNDYIYMSGGKYCLASCNDLTSTYTTDVQYAKINPDGTLGSWASAGTDFSNGRSLHKSVIYNGFFYILGGWQGSLGSAPSNVQYAKIGSDGTLGSWKTGAAMPTPRTAAAMVVLNGYLYVIGGSDTIATTNYVPLYAEGSLGAWAATDSITSGRGGIAGAVYRDTIYVGGGSSNNGATTYADVQYTRIKPAGETTAYTASGDFDTSGRLSPAAVVYKGYLYVTGGSLDNATTFSNVIRKATIGSDGSLSGWTNTSNTFSKSRYQHGVVVHNSYMYIYGGYGTCGFLNALDYCNDVQYASIGANGDLGAFTTSPNNMLVARAAFSGVTYNGYLYTIGGRTSGGRQSDIDYAQIGVDNSVGAWQNNPTSLSRPQELHGVTAYGGFMYLTGGYDGTTIFRDIQYATINKTNGQIGTWTMVNPGDVGAWGSDKYGHAVWVYNGYLYQAGGCGGNDNNTACSNGTNDLQYRKIQPDGSIAAGSWTLASQSMNNDFKIFIGWAVAGDTVYFVGGRTDVNTIHKDVNRVRINNGGSGNLAAWSASGNSLTSARGQFSTAVSNGYIYVIGGTTTSGDLSEIIYASISNQGVLGSWQSSSSNGRNLPFSRSSHTSVVHNNYVYVFEGNTTDTSRTRYAKLLTTGGIASDAGCGSVWCGTAASGTNRSTVPSAYWNGYVYLSGSCSSSYCTSVEYAKLLDTGGVATNSGCGSSWCTTTALSRGRNQHQMVAYAGNLYVIGGFTSDATPNFINSVEYATINTNGSLGSWTATTITPSQVRNAGVVAINGYIYLIGGQYGSPGSGTGGTGTLRETMYAPILKSGAIGAWNIATNNYSQARAQSGVVNTGAYIVDVGGDNAATTKTYYNNVDITELQAISRTGQFSRLYDFDVGVKPTTLITRGTKQTGSQTALMYMSSNNTTNALDATQNLADAGYGGASPVTISLGTNRTLSRYLYLRYLIDDSKSAPFPDSGNESYITDFDMYYIANPGERLRGGRTFTTGADRGLDAQPQ